MPRYTELAAREAIAASTNWSEALRRLGVRAAGGNHRVLKRWASTWQIPTDHFAPYAHVGRHLHREPIPLEQVLVEHSTYDRGSLKKRLFASGLKARTCELCGQGEEWRGLRMSLVLDHINGVHDDNRIENLQIVCPNCAATLATHCARNQPRESARRAASRFVGGAPDSSTARFDAGIAPPRASGSTRAARCRGRRTSSCWRTCAS